MVDGLPECGPLPGVFELTVVDDPPNFMRRIQLPLASRPLTELEDEYVFRFGPRGVRGPTHAC